MVLQLKTIKYKCKTVYNNNTLVFEKWVYNTHLFCLLKFDHDSTIFPSLLLAYTFNVLDYIHLHNQLNTIRYSLCTMHCALFDIYYTLCTIHYALFDIYYALFTMHYAYVFIRIYYFKRIHTYSLFHMKIRRNPVILVSMRSSRRVE